VIEAVVFDMDGVIVDSEPVWQQVRVELMGEHGAEWTDADGDRCRGVSSADWSWRMAERLNGVTSAEDVFANVLERMVVAYAQRLPLFPGAVEAIERISTRYMVAVASGSPRELVDFVLAGSGLDRLCDAVGYGDEVPRGKPAPDIYIDVLEKLHVVPSKAVGVEDSESGLRSLHAAGMCSIAIVTPDYALPRDILAQTVATVGRLGDLTLSVIDGID